MQKCDICGKEFSSELYLSKHKKSHLQEGEQISCELCDKIFTSVRAFKNHLAFQHEPTLSKEDCLECGKSFKSDIHLRQHLQRTHQNISKYECDVCGKRVKTIHELREHFLNVHDRVRMKCDICNMNFSASYINAHRLGHYGIKHKCDVCSKTFKHKRTLRFHFEKVHNEYDSPRPICGQCNKEFTQKSGLKRHISLVHQKSELVLCKKCNIKFASKRNLANHMKHIHERFRYECNVCTKDFASRSSLASHSSLHEALKYRCDICDKSYNVKPALKKHYKTHNTTLSCIICLNNFTTNCYLREHIQRVHK